MSKQKKTPAGNPQPTRKARQTLMRDIANGDAEPIETAKRRNFGRAQGHRVQRSRGGTLAD